AVLISSSFSILTTTPPTEIYTLSLHDALPILHLRERGAMRAAAVTGELSVDEVIDAVRAQPEMAGAALVSEVSARERFTFASERSEEHTSELQSRSDLVCRLLLEKKK